MTWKQIKKHVRTIKQASTADELMDAKAALSLAFVSAIANGEKPHTDKALLVHDTLLLYPNWR